MTNYNSKVVNTKIKRVFKATASVVLITVMAIVMLLSCSINTYADDGQNGMWAIKIGDKEVLYVDSQESGLQVIEGLKNYYLSHGSTVLDVQFDPAITVEKASAESAGGEVSAKGNCSVNVDYAVEQLSSGKVEYYVYKTVEGDTLSSIAKEKSLSASKLVKLNFNEFDSDETLKEGSYIVLYKEVPYLNVTTVEQISTEKAISYKTVYKKTSSLSKGKYKVVSKGVKGSRETVKKVTKLNGEVTESEEISSEVTKKAQNKVVLKGTSSVTARRNVTFDFVDGSEIVDYAKKFVGNPYRYGGCSLTNGTDCSGFVYSVYKHFGINLPRCGQTSVGKTVSYSNVKKGDILFYPGHVAIYAGNGKAVHAVNERLGIRVTSVGYTGRVIAVRRIVS